MTPPTTMCRLHRSLSCLCWSLTNKAGISANPSLKSQGPRTQPLPLELSSGTPQVAISDFTTRSLHVTGPPSAWKREVGRILYLEWGQRLQSPPNPREGFGESHADALRTFCFAQEEALEPKYICSILYTYCSISLWFYKYFWVPSKQ